MMIWLSKQHLGMREVVEMDVAQRYPIPPEIEAKDMETLEREINEFFAELDFSKGLPERDASVDRLEAQNRNAGQARSR